MNKKLLTKNGFIVLIIVGLITLVTLTIIAGGVFVYNVDREMMLKMEQKQMIQPTIFYSRAATWKIGDVFPIKDIEVVLKKQLRERSEEQRLFAGDYNILKGQICNPYLENLASVVETDFCLRVFWEKGSHPIFKEPWLETLWLDQEFRIKGVFKGDPSIASDQFVLMPQVIAQYLGGDPILREERSLPDIPVACLNAIMAIEDAKFLEHKGVSPLGILRAVIVNLVKGRKAQGGSTLTQQLIKNYFLTPEKTMKRKALEFVMALLIEAHLYQYYSKIHVPR
jgi:penicillin-binding protein 1B